MIGPNSHIDHTVHTLLDTSVKVVQSFSDQCETVKILGDRLQKQMKADPLSETNTSKKSRRTLHRLL